MFENDNQFNEIVSNDANCNLGDGIAKKTLKKLNMEKIKIANMMFKKSNRELLCK